MKSERELLTVAEVADLLRVSQSGIYWMVNNRQLPTIRLGPRKLRFDRSEIEALIEARTTSAAA